MSNLELKQVKIVNLGMFEEQILNINEINILKGRNASGKTSILDSIKSYIIRGDNKSLIRKGCESGYIEVTYKEGGQIARAVKTFNINKPAKLQLWDRNNVIMPQAQTVVDSFHDAKSIDIGDFLDKKKDEQGEILLKACPLKTSKSEIDELLKPAKDGFGISDELREDALNKVDSWDEHALSVIEKITKYIFDSRTAKNHEIKRLTGHLETLMSSMDSDFDTSKDWSAEAEKVQASIDVMEKEKYEELQKMESDYEAEITKLREECRRKELLKADARNDILHEIEAKYHEKNETLVSDRETARANSKFEEQARMNKENCEATKADLENANTKSGAMSAAIDKLRNHKKELAEKLPIKGLEYKEDGIYLDGLKWSQVNSARSLELSLEVTDLKFPEGGSRMAFIDGFERLDAKTTKKFIESALKKNITIIGGKVADCDLTQQSEKELLGGE